MLKFQGPCFPPAIGHNEINIAGEIHQYLPARAAGGSKIRVIGDDRDRFEISISFRDRLEYCCALGTDRQCVRADFDVAPRVNLPIGGKESCPDSKLGIGGVGALLCMVRGLDELIVGFRHFHKKRDRSAARDDRAE